MYAMFSIFQMIFRVNWVNRRANISRRV